MKLTANFEVDSFVSELRQFTVKVQNNIHIGALRQATNVIKDELAVTPTEAISKRTLKRYSKSFKRSDIKVKKRRRTKAGWERFKITIVPPATKEDPKQLRWNVIQNSKFDIRRTKKGYSRGRLSRDNIMQRATIKAKDKALNAFKVYLKARIERDGGRILKKDLKGLL